jgi:hypothetical protein
MVLHTAIWFDLAKRQFFPSHRSGSRDGKLPKFPLGGTWRFQRADIEEWIGAGAVQSRKPTSKQFSGNRQCKRKS